MSPRKTVTHPPNGDDNPSDRLGVHALDDGADTFEAHVVVSAPTRASIHDVPVERRPTDNGWEEEDN